MSGDGPVDFQRCLELASIGNHQDQLFKTLTAMIGYYLPRAELRRARELLDSLSGRISEDRAWSDQAIASSLGSVTLLEGDFDSARGHLLRALANQAATDARAPETATSVGVDPISSAQIYLALTHMVAGDLERADAAFAESIRRCGVLAFPENAHNRAHTYFIETLVKLESGQLPEAGALVADLRELSEASGLDLWRLVGATQQSTVKALTALDTGADAAALTVRAEKLARLVDGSRLLHLNIFLTFHDAIIGRLLIAAGQPANARERLDMSLRHAEETGMHFYDAELMRVRAHTFAAPQKSRDALRAGLDLARRQGAILFELRCSTDLFEFSEGADRVGLADAARRFTGDHRWPEVTRAQTLLRCGADAGK
jgi:tetratricopeptide (TPR) repeat protein